jgi:ADP-ribose pyrophosphatase
MTRRTEASTKEKVVSSQLIYKGRAVKLRRKEVSLPNGRRTVREIIEHHGSVGIVPLLDDGRLVVIRQFRLAAGGVIWEIPAGTMERGETPAKAAKRELEEETGYRAGAIKPLFDAYLAPGYSMEMMHFFVATSLVKTKQATEEDEIVNVYELRPEKVLMMIEKGEIVDAKSIAAILYLYAVGQFGSQLNGRAIASSPSLKGRTDPRG